MATVLVYPGTKGEPVPLVDVLREAHDAVREAIDAEIKTRKASGAPLIWERTGEPIDPLGAHEPDPACDGVVITMQIVSDGQRRAWDVRREQHAAAYREAQAKGDTSAMLAADEAAWSLMGEIVGAVVVELRGVVGLTGSVADAADALRGAGLLAPLHDAARHFLGLPRKKALRCGLPQQST